MHPIVKHLLKNSQFDDILRSERASVILSLLRLEQRRQRGNIPVQYTTIKKQAFENRYRHFKSHADWIEEGLAERILYEDFGIERVLG